MAEQIQVQHLPAGVALSHQALSPKLGAGWRTLYWTGPDPRHPRMLSWSTDAEQAATFPTEAAAVDAFATLGSTGYLLPAPQLQLADDEGVEQHGADVVCFFCAPDGELARAGRGDAQQPIDMALPPEACPTFTGTIPRAQTLRRVREEIDREDLP